jgi:hypothetical protein
MDLATHKIPKLKIMIRATFVLVLICNRTNAGSGNKSRIELVAMLAPAYENHTPFLFKQWPGIVGSQNFLIGEQKKRLVKKGHIQLAIIRTMVHHRAITVFPPVKIRRYWSTMDSLEQVRVKLYMNMPKKKRFVCQRMFLRIGAQGLLTLRNLASLSGSAKSTTI